MNKYKVFFGVVLFWATLSEINATSSYDAFQNAVKGGPHTVGLGGAQRALAAGMGAGRSNPAGLSLMREWWDGSLSLGMFSQEVSGLKARVTPKSQKIAYVMGSVAFKIEQWKEFSFGLMIYSPYAYSMEGAVASNLGHIQDSKFSLSYDTLAVPLSFRPSESFYVGGALRLISTTMKFSTKPANQVEVSKEVTGLGWGYDFGSIYKPSEKYRFALTYHSADDLGIHNQDSTSINGFTPFHTPKTPARFYLGSAVKFNDQWTALFDAGLLFPVSEGAVPGTDISSADDPIDSGIDYSLQYFAGIQYAAIPKHLNVLLGHYYQPARSDQDPDRYHITTGLEVIFWYLKIGAAVDYAEDYYNLAFSIGPHFPSQKK